MAVFNRPSRPLAGSFGIYKMSKNFYIFGAGFTKSIFDYAPLNDQLVNALLDLNPSSPLKSLSEKYGTQDIELLLTKLDIDIQQGQHESELRICINTELAEYFQQFRFKSAILNNKKWLEEFALNIFHKNDVILNLNYECFLEGLLDYLEIWNPNQGYGTIENMLVGEENINTNNIQILKIHGSENFTLQNYFDKPECASLSFEFNKQIFPKSAAHSFLGPRSIPMHSSNKNSAKPYIIAPSYVKIPTVEISYLMLDAMEAIQKSKNVIVVGCGLRPEDSFLWLLLTRFLRHPEWKKRKIIIISPEANSLGTRIKQYWGVNVNDSVVEIPSKLEDAIEQLIELTQ